MSTGKISSRCFGVYITWQKMTLVILRSISMLYDSGLQKITVLITKVKIEMDLDLSGYIFRGSYGYIYY